MQLSILCSAARPLAVLSLTSLVSAQTTVPDLRFHGDTIWPGTSTPGDFRRAVSGDFDDNGTRDVAVLAGDELVYFYSPASWAGASLGTPRSTAYDVAVLPRGSGATGDDFALVDGTGLLRAVWQPSTSSFSISSMATSTTWQSVRRLRTADVDANGAVDCVGITSDGHTVAVRRIDTAGVGHTTTFTLSETILDFRILQWDGGTNLELALLDSYGVEIYTYGGSLVAQSPRVATAGDTIATFRKAGASNDRVAWVRRRSSDPSTQELVELAWSSTTTPMVTVATGIQFPSTDLATALVAADVPSTTCGDSDELLVQHTANHVPLLYWGTESGASAVSSASFTWAASGVPLFSDTGLAKRPSQYAAYVGAAAPLFEDLSGDGVLDLFLYVKTGSGGWFQTWRGQPSSTFGAPPVTTLLVDDTSVPDMAGNELEVPTMFSTSQVPGVTGDLRLQLRLPPVVDATHLEIVVWNRDPVGLTPDYDYTLFHRFVWELPSNWTGGTLYPSVPMNFDVASISQIFATCQSKTFWMGVHLAKETATNVFRIRGEDYVTVVTTNNTEANDLYDSLYDSYQCVHHFVGCNSNECVSAGSGIAHGTANVKVRRFIPTGGFPPSTTTGPISLGGL